ncbi:MAG: hypothetical protein AB7O97_17265 [Planctomycetota bacterium]
MRALTLLLILGGPMATLCAQGGKDGSTAKVDAPDPPAEKASKPGDLRPSTRSLLPVRPLTEQEIEVEAAKRALTSRDAATFDPSCQPRRVPAGGRGTVVVLMLLKGDSVLLSPPPVKFGFAPTQGNLTVLGQPTFRPPDQAGLAPALKDLPAYDNYAVFEVPFAVDAGATAGTEHLQLTIQYELIDGQRGGSLGAFRQDLAIDVPVVAVADEPVVVATNSPTSTAPATDAGSTPLPADDGMVTPVDSAAPDGHAVDGVVDSSAEPDSSPDGATPRPEGASGSLWLAAGAIGVALAALLLVALRRRAA